jgi:hypothetical protein
MILIVIPCPIIETHFQLQLSRNSGSLLTGNVQVISNPIISLASGAYESQPETHLRRI